MSDGGRSSTTRHIATVPSAEPVASRSAAAGLKATAVTAERCASSTICTGRGGSPVSHTISLRSCDPLARRRPSARKATQLTGAACAGPLGATVTRTMLDINSA